MPDLALSRRDLVAEAAAALRRAGIAEARREALRLWAEIAPGAGEALLLGPEQAVEPGHQRRLQELGVEEDC